MITLHLAARQDIIKVVKAEEESFLNTLTAGLQLFEQLTAELKNKQETTISGEAAFKLYDTYGFPLDLTTLLAEEEGFDIDYEAYKRALKEQQERSRKGSKFEIIDSQDEQSNVTPDIFEGLPLHLAEDLNVAKGGEHRVISDRSEKVEMAKHHTATHLLHEVLRQTLGIMFIKQVVWWIAERLRLIFSFQSTKMS